jgi:hypothetical protein
MGMHQGSASGGGLDRAHSGDCVDVEWLERAIVTMERTGRGDREQCEGEHRAREKERKKEKDTN